MRTRYFLQRRAARAFGLKDYEKAIDALSDLLAVVGENPNTLHVAAVCHQRLGRLDEALELARRGISVDPVHLGCLEVLTESHVAHGDLDAAREFARRALAQVEHLNAGDASSRGLGGWRARLFGNPEPSAGQRCPTPEWIRWAHGLLEIRPGAGKS